ncbi:2OG-Fe(II) oxygenase [Azospirillum sp. sgz301742]
MILDLEAVKAATVSNDPFPHLVVPNFLNGERLRKVMDDFPGIDMPGLFPVEEVSGGPAFDALLKDMNSAELGAIMGEKFGVDLANRPTMTTVRSRARARDGQIHLDADFKMVTLLLYLNDSWQSPDGWLRTLRGPGDITNFAGQVAPQGGLLFAFKCTPEAWHGHTSFEGERRYVMMNYCVDRASMAREHARHRFTAKVKKFKRLFGIGKIAA